MGDIIKLTQGEDDDGNVYFSFLNNKWRCAQFEIEMALKDNKRILVEQEGKEKL